MKKKAFQKHYILMVVIIAILLFFACGFYSKLETTTYQYTSSKLPDAFDGYCIVQISDFHCKSFGTNESDLIQSIIDAKPDLIVLTGDMIDDSHTLDNVKHLLSGISSIAPIYSVTGNHEYDLLDLYDELETIYQTYGVTELDGNYATIMKNNQKINIYSIYTNVYHDGSSGPDTYVNIKNKEDFNLLLYHYSNYFDTISKLGFDLVLSGHTHGGIVRIPFVGGLLANDGSFFPKYDSGEFQKNGTTMISSRGLGDAYIPRFFNRSELVKIILHTK